MLKNNTKLILTANYTKKTPSIKVKIIAVL